MAAKTESELKYALDEPSYRKLLRHFPQGKWQRQTNVYFDDPKTWLLRRSRCGLRIRFTRGKKPILTFKQDPRGNRSSIRELKVRKEVESFLSSGKARALARGRGEITSIACSAVRALRQAVPAARGLKPLGHLKTVRYTTRYQHLVLEIDHYECFKQRFYELEVETTSVRSARGKLRELFKSLGLPLRPKSRSKLASFFALLSAA